MQIIPTYRTAIIAEIWSSLGLNASEALIGRASFGSVLTYNLVWLSAAAVFFVLPVVFMVFGQNTRRFSRTWFLDPEERAEYWIVAKRMFVWFVSAGAAAALISAASNFFTIR